MPKEQIVIVGMNITPTIIAQVRELYPNYEVTVVDTEADIKKMEKLFGPEPMKITREDLIFPEPIVMQDIKFNNPWPSHHHSSKRNKKY